MSRENPILEAIPDEPRTPWRRSWIGSVVIGTVTLALAGLLIAFAIRAALRPAADDEGNRRPAAEESEANGRYPGVIPKSSIVSSDR